MIDVLLIGGSPRSGTGLMRRLLGSHPDVYLPSFELEFHRRLARGATVHDTLEDLSNRFEGLELNQLDAASHATIFRSLLAYLARRHQVRVAGDKTPETEHHLDWYAQALRPARIGFVHMIRNPFDVVASHVNATWNHQERTPALIAHIATKWATSVTIAEQPLPQQFQRIVVRYEDLVADPADAARSLTTALGLSSSEDQLERMLALADYPLYVNSSFADHGGTTVLGGVQQLASRRVHLTDDETALIARTVEPVCGRWGYDTT